RKTGSLQLWLAAYTTVRGWKGGRGRVRREGRFKLAVSQSCRICRGPMTSFFSSSPRRYVRRASHAGSWYTDDGKALDQQLEEWLSAVQQVPAPLQAQGSLPPPRVRAIIAPHAGYSYSGATAAHAYTYLDPRVTKRVFILGPSHHVHLSGCAISLATHLDTPLGQLAVDKDVVAQLMRTGKFEAMTQDVDEDEHSIEMHLPYVKKRMGDAPCSVVAIMVGATSEAAEARYGALLAPYLRDPANFFIVSSDFCHWGARFRYQPHDAARGAVHEYIRWLDHAGMALLEAQDLGGFYAYLREHRNTICGRHPICAFMHAVRALTSGGSALWSVLFVRYAQSSACTSHRDSSVSYASAVVS
ncbi:MEMO1 family, partial [Tribonema minus]